MSAKPILDGVTVLDLTQFIAGPVTTRAMAEMGAEVIKLELAPKGDQSRALPVIKNGRSAYFAQQNQGKRGIAVDLRQPRGLAIVKQLVAKADVLVENFSPGAIGRLGLGWEVVHELNPRLTMCSISAFGQSGPLANQPGFDYIAQAYSGVTSMMGEPGEAPPLIGVAVGDVGTALAALAAINGALYQQARHGGPGQFLDIALVDFYFLSHSINVEAYSASGGAIRPTRAGSQHPFVAPNGIYKGRDGFVVILAVTQDMWLRLLRAMEMPALAEDPRFRRNEDRDANRPALTAIIEDWLASFDNIRAAVARLLAERVPAAPVLSVAEAVAEPHLVERGTVREVVDPTAGRFLIPGIPLRFSEMAVTARRRAPYLGEHNEAVLTGYLGYAPEAVRALERDGVLLAEPLPVEAAAE